MQETDSRSVLFDRGPLGTGSLFRRPERIIEAWTPEDVGGALRRMEACQAAGKWLAGTLSYELGYALTPKILSRLPADRRVPLLRFGVFDRVEAPSAPDCGPDGEPEIGHDASVSAFRPDWDFETYEAAFDAVHGYLCAGDIYQANLTFPMTAEVTGGFATFMTS